MENKRTFDNQVLIKLDAENKSIRLRNGCELFIDCTFDPEKHQVVTGKVWGLPSHLRYTGKGNDGMPWDCPMELKYGDGVIIYYLSIVNALSRNSRKYIIEGEDKYVWVQYSSVYTIVRGEKIIPINGYVLIEPITDPSITREKERMKKAGIELCVNEKRGKEYVTFGIIRYVGAPNRQYVDEGQSDEGVDVVVGDTVVIKRSNDIPLQYGLHAKIDGGKKLLRIQRRNLFAKL